jgi:CBS domain-containing protein
MPINECCNLGVICCETEASITEVAALMRKHHVGDVIVVEPKDGARLPIGIVTDRDIVIEALAPRVEVGLLTAGDIMSAPLVTVQENEGLLETLRFMRNHGIRRAPVVTEAGTLFGIVTADDISYLLAVELSMITKMMIEQPIQEGRIRH